jgi:hypothetical protein
MVIHSSKEGGDVIVLPLVTTAIVKLNYIYWTAYSDLVAYILDRQLADISRVLSSIKEVANKAFFPILNFIENTSSICTF